MPSALNSREWAVAIWLSIGLAVCLTRRDLRPAIGAVVTALTRLKFLSVLLLMTAYVAVIVALAASLDVWDSGLVGGTMTWFLGSATVLLMNSIRRAKESGYLRRAIMQAAGVAILVEGLVNLYPFPVYVEFFVVPTLAALVAIAAVAESKPEFTTIRKPINGLLRIFGLGLIFYATIRLATKLSGASLPQLARSIALPVWLSLALLLFTYVVGLVGAYEMAFLHIGFCDDASPQARRRAKFALLLGVGPRAHRLACSSGPSVRRLVAAPSLAAANKVVTDLGAAREPENAS